MPRIDREEFINVGLAMMCKRRRWLRLSLNIPAQRVKSLSPDTDLDALARQLQSLADIAEGKKSAGPIAEFPPEERFRWISAEKSSVIQCSRPHPGIAEDLDATFNRLFSELVM
ncbi:MAG: DUF3037 domain-containing protein [Clostridium sp.]|nr:DUF3037 domain-containing protein [Clostridium sp.]